MIQIRFLKVGLQFGEYPLLTDINFTINRGDRVAILGRNGAGKSTLLKLIQGAVEPDSGSIEIEANLKIAIMHQELPAIEDQTVYSFLEACYKAGNEWETHRIDQVISLVNLDRDALISSLSGGQTRRLSLAEAIINEPDVLLLDEPTNHLDIESIEWLEKFLLRQNITLVLITHDREFMQKIATRIFEIDLTRINCCDGSYQEFLSQKDTRLRAEKKERALFDKKLAEEEVWIRQGIKARRTRNEGRVRALEKMREQFGQRRHRQGQVSHTQQKVDYASKIAIEANAISMSFDNNTVIDNFNMMLLRGDKIGIIGPNGCGKSTMINILLDDLEPSQGTVKRGTQLNAVVFDQHRAKLNLDATAIDNVAEGALQIDVNGKSKHVISYLQDFLFTPEKARSKVKTFSGGERNRLLLAKILAKPANLLVLDEPTNDLDMETLEFLEEYISDYPGSLILVSHDRVFLDNVVTSTIAYEGEGKWQEYVGGYQDYLRQRKEITRSQAANASNTAKPQSKQSSKLSYKDQRELDMLPGKIEALENKIKVLQEEICNPDFYQQDKDIISSKQSELQSLEQELDYAFTHWDELSTRHD
jgi:ATP-binding cassette subfamily F protein uup